MTEDVVDGDVTCIADTEVTADCIVTLVTCIDRRKITLVDVCATQQHTNELDGGPPSLGGERMVTCSNDVT